jgi:Mg-chelatase subunit ChlD
MVLYKDYYDEYLNRVIPFTGDFEVFQRNLSSIQVRGGGDIPEAVYEALYAGASKFNWEAESRLMILIGDAPPHPRQRGSISKAMVDEVVEKHGIKVHAIILPN